MTDCCNSRDVSQTTDTWIHRHLRFGSSLECLDAVVGLGLAQRDTILSLQCLAILGVTTLTRVPWLSLVTFPTRVMRT
jgi:hypothetical protein